MASYNKVLLMGNLTRDIELRHTPNNQAVATIGLAVNRRYRTESGENREEVTYVDCDAWGKTAEIMAQYLSKGKPVFIEGRLKLDTWQDKQSGENRSKLKIVIDSFQFIDSKAGGGEGGGGGPGGGGAPAGNRPARSGAPAPRSGPPAGKAPRDDGSGYEQIQDDDIPF